MKLTASSRFLHLGAVASALIGAGGLAQAAGPADPASTLEALQRKVNEQSARLESLKRSVAKEEADLNEVKRVLNEEVMASARARGVGPDGTVQTAQAATASPTPVGQAPESEDRVASVAQIFDQRGVLTPKGKVVLEPSLSYSYSSNNRVALVGYTIIPAITIGLIDVREVKSNTTTAVLTGRYGVTNRFEIEARLPYAYRSDSSVGCPLNTGNTGCASDTVFDTSSQSLGDIEVSGRYQFSDAGTDKPIYIGSLRYKSRSGKSPFEVPVDTSISGLGPVQTELPTGSGFDALQPAFTVLFPSDPAVFFGTVSYLYNFSRNNVSQKLTSGSVEIGKVEQDGIFGLNFGMGLGINEKSSFSIGYDLASVGRTKINGETAPGSVRVQLGTLLLGYSYRLDPQKSLNISLGVGATGDTPDTTLTVRMPFTF